MKKRKPLTPYQKRLIKLITNGVLATVALLFCVLSIGYLFEGKAEAKYLLSSACFFMAAIYVANFFFNKKTVLKGIADIGLAVFYLALMVISFFIAPDNRGIYLLFTGIFCLSIIFESIIHVIMKHKVRNFIFAILKILFAVLSFGLFSLAYTEADIFEMFFIFVPLAMSVIAFIHSMIMVFSGVRRTTIMQIIKKTYTIEILYGLIVLIVATALVLTIMEDNMTIGDALWYCFAIVTTIGFGDFTATTVVGRILSVILGIYGIIVVALITSIIVNFYTETKHDRGDEELKEEINKLEEDRKVEDKEETKE